MEHKHFPQRNASQAIGRKGELHFQSFIEKQLGWIYRPVHQESDNGLDGYVDLVVEGAVTGQSFAVQIKTGEKDFKSKTKYGFKYHGELKHLNFYMNNPAPVLLVSINLESEKMYWVLFDFGKITQERGKWWIEVPFDNLVDQNTRDIWLSVVGTANDFLEPLRYETAMTAMFNGPRYVMITIPHEEIKSSSLGYISHVVKRISKTREMAENNRNKMELSIGGYDDDERELIEIEEVNQWFKLTTDAGVPWFYLLDLSGPCIGIQLSLFCYCNAKKVGMAEGKWRVEIDDALKVKWLEQNFENLNSFCDYMKFDATICDKISGKVGDLVHRLFGEDG